MDKYRAIFWGLVLLVGIGLFLAVLAFYKTNGSTASLKPELKTDALTLLNDYKTNETQANEKYLDKIIEVSGRITGTEYHNGNMIILLGEKGEEEYIQCTLLQAKIMDPASTDMSAEVTIRGYCAGYLLNVIVNRAVLVDKGNLR